MPAFVLDTTAVMALLKGEAGSEQVEAILEQARQQDVDVYVAFITLMEVEYLALREHSEQGAQWAMNLLEAWPVRIVESNRGWGSRAAHVKVISSLSVADAWIAALAFSEQAELVHKDPEFDSVPGLRCVRLPYKPRQGPAR